MKYFIYCRKSSEEEERQALSIESQLIELREFAEKENLQVIKEYTESRSAKTLGRPVFDEMIRAIERKEADGIIAWAPDRISRNSVDGGRIIYLIDQGLIIDLKFPTYYFDNSPHGKFNLSIAFGQAKLYTDAMRENIMRGIRQKVRRGEFPGLAPLGYINNYRTRKIEPDNQSFSKIKSFLEKFSEGETSQAKLISMMFKEGFKDKKGNQLSFTSVNRILRNPFYYGLFKLKGELHQGSHKAMISKNTYDKIQNILDQNSKKINFHNHRDEKKNYFFPGLAECGECGYAITTEWHQKKSGSIFKYYRCTRKSKTHKCKQSPINEKDLVPQVEELVSQVSMPDYYYEKSLALVETWAKEEKANSKDLIEKIDTEIFETKLMIERLLDMRLSGDISQEEFRLKKNSLMNKKSDLESEKSQIIIEGNIWVEPVRDFIKTANQAEHSISNKNFQEMNRILKKVGLNRQMTEKKLSCTFLEPFNFLSEMHGQTEYSSIPDELIYGNNFKTQQESGFRSDGEGVSRSHHLQTASSETFLSSCCPRASEASPRAVSAFAEGECEWCSRSDLNT
jgi:site-specific DNA recombinase